MLPPPSSFRPQSPSTRSSNSHPSLLFNSQSLAPLQIPSKSNLLSTSIHNDKITSLNFQLHCPLPRLLSTNTFNFWFCFPQVPDLPSHSIFILRFKLLKANFVSKSTTPSSHSSTSSSSQLVFSNGHASITAQEQTSLLLGVGSWIDEKSRF